MTSRVHPIFRDFVETIERACDGPARQAPQPVDLLGALAQCAVELEEAAKLIAPAFPQVASLYEAAATRTRGTVERAREFGRA